MSFFFQLRSHCVSHTAFMMITVNKLSVKKKPLTHKHNMTRTHRAVLTLLIKKTRDALCVMLKIPCSLKNKLKVNKILKKRNQVEHCWRNHVKIVVPVAWVFLVWGGTCDFSLTAGYFGVFAVCVLDQCSQHCQIKPWKVKHSLALTSLPCLPVKNQRRANK